MGSDKALMKIDGITLLERSLKLIEPFCKDVAISGKKPEYENFSVIQIPDEYADCGPISGVFSSLKSTKSNWNLLISVDVPYVDSLFIGFLISKITTSDCVIPKHSSGIEPLIGIYHRKILSVLEKQILSGDYKLTNLISKLNVNFVDCHEHLIRNPNLFMNINKPGDFHFES